MSKLRETVEAALSKMNSAMPEITPEVIEQLKVLQQKMDEMRTKPPEPRPDGAYHGSLNSEYLRTLRDGLAVYRNIVLPAMMQQEVNKLRGVVDMAEALDDGELGLDENESPT